MQSEFTRVEQIVLDQLECPVCTEYMRPPITLCEMGHNICNICRPKVRHCPTCRQQILKTRNVALEKVAIEAKYPCVYRKYGCREICSLHLIDEHQEKCRYIPHPCPVNNLNIRHCSWLGIRSHMKSHMEQAHPEMCRTCLGPYVTQINFSIVTPDIWQFTFIFINNDIFCSRSTITNGIFYSELLYIGPAADAAKYKYNLGFWNKERMESLTITLLVRSCYEDMSEVLNPGDCVKLYPEQFSRFANERGELKFRVEIITVGRSYGHGYY